MADLAPTVRLQNIPNDNRQDNRHPVTRSERIVMDSTAHDGDAYNGSDTEIIIDDVELPNGKVVGIASAAPDIPSDANFQVEIIDKVVEDQSGGAQRSISVATKSGITDNGNTFTNTNSDGIYCPGGDKLSVRVSWSTAYDLTLNTLLIDLIFYMITP